MAQPKALFLADLRARIQANQHAVLDGFRPLDEATLTAVPAPNEWSILQCFDHLNLTHAYYKAKIEAEQAGALAAPVRTRATGGADQYAPSFWGRVYMFFALNPRFSFSAADEIAPQDKPSTKTLDHYLKHQMTLLRLLDQVGDVDLGRTRVPIARGVSFNLGDCLKILVYHDALHIDQAKRVRAQVATPTQQY